MASFLSPLLKSPVSPHTLVNTRTGQVIAANPAAAVDSATRRTGLLKHDSMPDGFALIIAPCWTNPRVPSSMRPLTILWRVKFRRIAL